LQVHASGPASKPGKPASLRVREGRARKPESSGLQLCKVCETRKQPQHFYNRHKTCKSCQCQINRIARSQHCSRDEAKRQVNASAHANRGTAAAALAPSGHDETPDALGAFRNAPPRSSCSLGAPLSHTSSGAGTCSPRAGAGGLLSHAPSSPPAAHATHMGSNPKVDSVQRRSPSPDFARMLAHEAGPALLENRCSHTGFKCDLNHLADVASAMLEADYDAANEAPPMKARRIMCAPHNKCQSFCFQHGQVHAPMHSHIA
jgi:hypothetical protein